MTRPHLVNAILVALLVSSAGRAGIAQTAEATPLYQPPVKSIKLSTEAAATLSRAKTAALVAIDVARLKLVSFDDKNKRAVVAVPGGIRRSVSAEKARSELMKSMSDWNRFAIVDDPEKADVVVVVFEDTVEPSAFTKATGDRKSRMRERLAVFARGQTETPLWAGEERESTLGALTGSPVGKVVDKFREELEKRLK